MKVLIGVTVYGNADCPNCKAAMEALTAENSERNPALKALLERASISAHFFNAY